MLAHLRKARYLPILKGKLGERRALRTVPDRQKAHVLPLIVVPPAGGYEHDEERVPTPAEHIRRFGPALHDHWGLRPAFVDARLIDDFRHNAAVGSHGLTELLERARIHNALACPVTGLGRSDDYQSAVRKFVVQNERLPIAVRAEWGDVVGGSLRGGLPRLLCDLRCPANRAFLVLDLGALHVDEPGDLADNLVELINDLPLLHEWLGFAVAITSFPNFKLNPGATGEYARTDWPTFLALLSRSARLSRVPIFGDYGLEHPDNMKPVKARPSSQLRYSTPKHYVIVKGENTAKAGYEAIYPVAERLLKRSDFFGPNFSAGDAKIDQLARRAAPHGDAPNWRWAGLDHHFTMVLNEQARIAGDALVAEESEPHQQSLFEHESH